MQPMAVAPLSGEFLEQKNLLRKLLAREAELAASVPGLDRDGGSTLPTANAGAEGGDGWATVLGAGTDDPMSFLTRSSGALTPIIENPLLKGLQMLERERQLIQQLADLDGKKPSSTVAAMKIVAGTPLVPPPGSATAAAAAAATVSTVASPPARQPLITAALYARQQAELGEEEPPEGAAWGEAGRGGDSTPVSAATTYKRAEKKRDDPLLVIIRHGKTGPSPHHSVEIIVPVLSTHRSSSFYYCVVKEYNKLGIFTGWLDVPLSEDGRKEAMAAGRLLKRHGITFDVVYTSWLSRAIETAWLVLDELDCLWLPIIKVRYRVSCAELRNASHCLPPLPLPQILSVASRGGSTKGCTAGSQVRCAMNCPGVPPPSLPHSYHRHVQSGDKRAPRRETVQAVEARVRHPTAPRLILLLVVPGQRRPLRRQRP